MAAQSLHRSKAGLGDWFRRLKSKLGTKAAVTAAAHKMARILWAMVNTAAPMIHRD
jgi:transposase